MSGYAVLTHFFIVEQALAEEVREIVLPLLSHEGVELVELILNRGKRRPTLRFLLDKPDGITLDECARLNRKIGQALDEGDLLRDGYVLEVSSPGLNRNLKTARDFQRIEGKLVRFVLHQAQEGQNVWTGFVGEVNEQDVVIRTKQDKILRICRNNIARAKLELEV